MTKKKSKTTKRKESSDKPSKEMFIPTPYLIAGIVILAVIIGGVFWYQMKETPATTPSIPTSTDGAILGSSVSVRYVGTLEDGTVFDTNIAAIAEQSNVPVHDELLTFTIGQNQVIKGFEDGLVGMKVGEEKVITVSPEDGYGTYDTTKVLSVPRIQEIPRIQNINRNVIVPLDEFTKVFNVTPTLQEVYYVDELPWGHKVESITDNNVHLTLELEKGKSYTFPKADFPAQVVDMNESTIILKQNPKDGQIVETNMGATTLHVTDDTITMTLDPIVGTRLNTQNGPAVIKAINGDTMDLDFNHPLAGKTLQFKVLLESLQ